MLFAIGCVIASFINATLYRLDNNYKWKELILNRSHCEKCKHVLSWWELIPIVGYAILKGKCRKCKEKISVYYPLSELFLGLSFLLFGFYSAPLHAWIALIFLFSLSYYDYIYKAIPQMIVHLFLIFALIYFCGFNLNLPSLIAAGVVLAMIGILVYFLEKSFGLGDILLLIGLGLLLNYNEFLVLFWVGILTAIIFCIFYSLIKKKKFLKIKIPMVPFFTFSYVIAVVFGNVIFDFIRDTFNLAI